MEKIIKLKTDSSIKCCSGHILHFVSSAKAYINGADNICDLLELRKKGINGNWL